MGQKIKDQIIFAGSGLDTDSDNRYIAKGDTDVRYNLIPSADGQQYVLHSVPGDVTKSHAFSFPGVTLQNPQVVGGCVDASNDMHYYFICDDAGVQYILRYNVYDDIVERVLPPVAGNEWNNLGLTKGIIIHDAFVLDNYLFWNPISSSPRMLDIPMALNFVDYIDWIPKASYDAGDKFYYKGKIYEVVSDTTLHNDLIEEIEGTGSPLLDSIAIVSAEVTDGDRDEILLTFDDDLNEYAYPSPSAFTVTGNTVTGVSVSGDKVTLTLAGEYLYTSVIVVSYVVPSINQLTGLVGGTPVLAFSDFSVTNNIAAPSPVLVTAVIENDAPSDVVLTFDMIFDDEASTEEEAWTLSSPTKTISGAIVSGNQVTLTVTVPYTSDDTDPSGNYDGTSDLYSVEGGYVMPIVPFWIENMIHALFDLSVYGSIDMLTEFGGQYSGTYNINIVNNDVSSFYGDFRMRFRGYVGSGSSTTDYFYQTGVPYTVEEVEDYVTVSLNSGDPPPSNINLDKEYSITLWYRVDGTNGWAPLDQRVWNMGL